MFFLSDSERSHLLALVHKQSVVMGNTLSDSESSECEKLKIEPDGRHTESDAHLVFEGLHTLANGNADRLYALLHSEGHKSHPEANAGRTLLLMHKIATYGSACDPGSMALGIGTTEFPSTDAKRGLGTV
jgi:hypothetical protein